MTLTILLLIIPFIGASIALIGKSWDEAKKSKIKLTARGWVSLSIIVIGFIFTGINTYKTQIENESLKEQKEKVRSIVYDKIDYDCLAILRPLIDTYLENSNAIMDFRSDNYRRICLEMTSDSGQLVFKRCNLFDSVKNGTAFDEWDKSCADYIHGYYNSKYFNSLEQTMTKWANYIDMGDVILIDSILTHPYLTTLGNLNYRNNKSFYFFGDKEILIEQNEFIRLVYKLWNKSAEVKKLQLPSLRDEQ